MKLQDLINNQEGRTKLAAAMAAPLRRQMNMGSVAKQAFSVDPLIKCSECGSEFHELHPNNGCSLGHVYNIMET